MPPFPSISPLRSNFKAPSHDKYSREVGLSWKNLFVVTWCIALGAVCVIFTQRESQSNTYLSIPATTASLRAPTSIPIIFRGMSSAVRLAERGGNLRKKGKLVGEGTQVAVRYGRAHVGASGLGETFELDDYANVRPHVAEFLKRIYGVDKVDAYGRLLWKNDMAQGEQWNGSEASSDPSLFTYGEVLPEAVEKLMDTDHLDIENANVVFEVGCGRGKLATQIFHQYPHIKYVAGIEKSQYRYEKCQDAASKMHLSFLEPENPGQEPEGPFIVRKTPSRTLATTPSARTLEFRLTDIVDILHVVHAMLPEVVIFNVCHAPELIVHFQPFFEALPSGCRIVTYEDLETLWNDVIKTPFPFQKITQESRFYTTWDRNDGHQFYLWKKR